MKNQFKEKTQKNKRMKKLFARNVSGWLIMLPSLFLFIMLVWRPIIIGISYSFFELKGFTPMAFVGFKNFRDVLTDTDFVNTLWNTVQYVFWSIIVGYPLPIIAAILMNEMVHCKSYFKITTYLPVIIPSIATSMIWAMIYRNGEGGLLNMMLYYFGMEPISWLDNKSLVIPLIVISMTWNSFGGTLVIILATLQGVNQELYEAARLDGAGFIGRVRHVMFPHMRGLILLMLIRQIISVFNVTEQPLSMTGGGPNGASLSLGLTNYFYAFRYGHYDKSLALGVITFCILVGLTFVYYGLDKRVDD